MKSAARTAVVCAVLLLPVLASAQMTYTQTMPGVSSYSSQIFTGGTTFGPGGFFMGGGFGGPVGGIAGNFIFIINTVLVPLVFAISFIVFLYGVAKAYIFSHGDEAAVASGHKTILWGLIGFAVMVSVWGLVNVVAITFGLGGAFAPPLPSSYSPFMGPPPPPPPR